MAKEPIMGAVHHARVPGARAPEDTPKAPKTKGGGEYGAGSEDGILDLTNDSAIDGSNQGYTGQPGLYVKRGHDPIEVDPGSVPYPVPIEKDKPEGSPAE